MPRVCGKVDHMTSVVCEIFHPLLKNTSDL